MSALFTGFDSTDFSQLEIAAMHRSKSSLFITGSNLVIHLNHTTNLKTNPLDLKNHNPGGNDVEVPEVRLELTRKLLQRLLRPQRLPISPSGLLAYTSLTDINCLKSALVNEVPRTGLEPARLPATTSK